MSVWHRPDSVAQKKPLDAVNGRVDDLETGLMEQADMTAEISEGLMEQADMTAEISEGLMEQADATAEMLAALEERVAALEAAQKGA